MQKKLDIHLLLDTHAFIWLMNGDTTLSPKICSHIENILKIGGGIGLSAISQWEISMLVMRKKILLNQPLYWIQSCLKAPGVYLCEITSEIAVDSCSLPNNFHGDSTDRMIVATARALNIPLLTRDEKILAYDQQGYVQTMKT